MNSKEENIKTESKEPNKKSFFRRLFKWFFILIAFLIILTIGLFLFIQTDTFDKIALGFALDKINSSLASKDITINAESLTGNIFKGFQLNNGSIKVKEDTLLKFNSIKADYSIRKLLNKEISVQNLILKEPQINLTKVKDKHDSLRWNLDYLLESEDKEEDTTKSEFDWKITAENISIENGAFRILEEKDSSLPIRDIIMMKLDTFKFGQFDVTDLNIKLSAKYFPDSKEVDLKNLSCNTNSEFNIKKMTLQASINEQDTGTSIRNFEIITDKSEFVINELFMKDFDPLHAKDYEKFKDNNTKLNLDIKKINFADLIFFLPDLNFLDSTVSLKLVAEGNYGDLGINKLDLITPNSTYSFTGNVKNLNKPSELYFDIRGNNIEIDPRDTKLILPGLSIPDYSYLGKVYIPYLAYKGEPDRFSSDFDIRTSAGNAIGNVYLDLTQDVARYKGDVSASNLNLGKIVKDKSLECNINGDFKVDATGFDYSTATGKLNYSLSRTKFFGQNISKSDGQLNFNRGNVNLDIAYNSDAVKTKMAGKINISNLKNISYDLKGTVSGLNISAFTKDNTQSSNLNFDFDINGRGFNPNSITGDFKINMNSSTYAGQNIPEVPLEVELDQNGNIKKVLLRSEFADISADGEFNFNSLASVISNNIEKIKSEIESGNLSDSAYFSDSLNTANNVYTTVCENINLNYSIDVKDLTPIYAFIGFDSVTLIGKIDGNINDSCGLFSLTAEGDIQKFRFNDSLIITEDAKLNAFIKNDLSGYKLTKLNASVNLKTDKLIASKILLDTTYAGIKFENNKNNFLLWTSKDSTIKLFTEGSLKDSLIVNFDSLAIEYHKFLVTNNKNLILKYNNIDSSRSIEFRQFSVNNLDQKLTVAGKYSLTDSSDLKITSSNISLSTYQKLLNEDLDTLNMISGKIRYFDLNYTGTTEFPVIDIAANSDILKIGSTKIGRLDANINYKDFELTPNIVFYNEKNTGNFSLLGNIPIYLTLSDNELDSARRLEIFKNKAANLNAVADNFQLKVFQQLLPYTGSLEGILNGKISLIGTSLKPQLTGNMDIDKGKVYITLTKMNYDFNAKLASENANLLIKDSKIFLKEEPSRFISASGYLNLTGFTMNDLYLEMSGDLKAFDKDNGSTELGISGDLWVGSGQPKLKIKGGAGRIDLTGNLVLIKGNVTFNPFVQKAYNIYSDDFKYGVILDSVRSDSVYVNKTIMESLDSVLVLKNLVLNPFEKILYSDMNSNLKKVAKEKSGLFFYNLYVSTGENVFLKFIVNEKSQQEFFGEIKTDLFIDNKDNYEMSGRGKVILGDNCYYKFFRKFDAKGYVTFTGPLTNPDLDINAEYKGNITTDNQSNGAQRIEDVLINLKVTGKAENPTLTISIDKGGVTESGSSASSDAISFLLFGKFSDQLSFGESTSFGANLGASFLSTYVSSSFEEIFPFLINTNVNYIDSKTGSFAENTDIRFTAAFGDAIIRFGGQVFKGISNTDIAVDYPLNKLFKVESLSNNFFIRLERYYDPLANQNDISSTSGKRTGALLYYKLKF